MKLFFILLLFPTVMWTQYPQEMESKIDSLKAVLDKTEEDSVKVKSWSQWDALIYRYDPELDYHLNKKIDSLCSLNLKKDLEVKDRLVFLRYHGEALNALGVISKDRGEYDLSISYYKKSLIRNSEANNYAGMGRGYGNLASVYRLKGDHGQAADHYYYQYRFFLHLKDSLNMAKSLSGMALSNRIVGDSEQAVKLYRESLDISDKIGDRLQKANTLNNLSLLYQGTGEFKLAKEAIKSCLEIRWEYSDSALAGVALINLGSVEFTEGDSVGYYGSQKQADSLYEEAVLHCLEGMELINGSNRPDFMAIGESSLAAAYVRKRDYQSAIKYATSAMELAEELDLLETVRIAAEVLHESYKNTGQPKKALEMLEKEVAIQYQIHSEENRKNVMRQEFRLDYEKKEAVASARFEADLEQQEAVAKEKERTQITIIIAVSIGFVLLVVFSISLFKRFKVTNRQKEEIEEQKAKVDRAYDRLEEKNNEITDSITYAKRIQEAILPPEKMFQTHLENSFVLYKPKDIVAGDFYWLEVKNNIRFLAAADCTGHGVPGAMVSVVCHTALNRAVREFSLTDPGEILDKVRELVLETFEKSEREVRDGMDIALCAIEGRTLKFAGAHNPIWIVRNGELSATKGDKQPVGSSHKPVPFTTHTFEMQEGDLVYLFSDGFADQFGGEKGKKLKSKTLRTMILEVSNLPCSEQKTALEQGFNSWKEGYEQVDDVCLIGFQIT